MPTTGWRVESAIAPATSDELMKKYSGATIAAVRISDDGPSVSHSGIIVIATPATETVNASDAILKMIRCAGLRALARSVHCAHALTVAMHTAGAGPSANSAQKFTACES